MVLQMGWDINSKVNITTPALINFSTTGDNTIVAGISGKTIQIWRFFLVVDAATNLTFKDGSSTSLTGAMNLPINGSVVLDHHGDPWFVTSSGNNFVINQSGTAQVSGAIYYTQK